MALTNTQRAEILRIEKARKQITYNTIAAELGCSRQNVNKIANTGKPGNACNIRRKLANLAGFKCDEFWCSINIKNEDK